MPKPFPNDAEKALEPLIEKFQAAHPEKSYQQCFTKVLEGNPALGRRVLDASRKRAIALPRRSSLPIALRPRRMAGQAQNGHVRGAPHPQTQGKIERWRQTLKNRILLENYNFVTASNLTPGPSVALVTGGAILGFDGQVHIDLDCAHTVLSPDEARHFAAKLKRIAVAMD